jgi:hypothetical protein
LACSVSKRHKQGGTAFDPVLSRLISEFQINLDHEGIFVDGALSDGIVVAGALVHVGGRLDSLLDRLKLNHGHEDSELHDIRFHQGHPFKAPFGTLKIEA